MKISTTALSTTFLFNISIAIAGDLPLKFDFGSGIAKEGYMEVNSSTIYTHERRFGFDFSTAPALPGSR